MAADTVEEQVYRDAGARLGAELRLERAAQTIVAHNIELHQHIARSAFDGGQDRLEGGLAVDQKLDPVTVGKRQFRQLFQGLRRTGVAVLGQTGREVVAREWASDHGSHLAVVLSARLGVSPKLAAPEGRVQRKGKQRESHQAHCPGGGTLRSARLHHRVYRRGNRKQFQKKVGQAKEPFVCQRIIPPGFVRAWAPTEVKRWMESD